MSEPVDTASQGPKRRFFSCGCLPSSLLLGIILVLLFSVALGPIGPSIRHWAEMAAMQQSRSIYLMLFSYANDHSGNYPEGKSSTEVFQKLLDGGYCEDPSFFYIPRAGKFKAQPGQKLKPENVCFDVTSGLDLRSSDYLPVVFSTGYKVNYLPDGAAIPLKTVPQFYSRTWLQWWNGDPKPWAEAGIAVCYKSNNAQFTKLNPVINPDGSTSVPYTYRPDAFIPHFISPDFKPDGRMYRQLTPDGALP